MFFTDEIIREFREETPEIKTYLMHHKKKLIHLEEIRHFLQWTPKEEEGREDLYQFITKWTTKICGHGISDMYGASSLMIALSAPDKQFDAIFIVDEDYLEKLQEKSDVNDKLNLVYSVMIVQKGECELKPRTVAVRLICSRKTMKANILMGAYLYAIKKKGAKVDQTGILELADGFKNLQGFCLYTKFGFKEDKRLYVPVLWKRDTSEKGNWRYKQNRDKDLWVPDPTFYDFNKQTYKQKRKCFGNQENLPMSVDLTHITEEAIIKTTTTGSPIRKNTTLLQKSASVFQLTAVPKPQDLCTSLKAETAEESRVQSAIADLYSKMHNAELDVENNVFHTGQMMDDFQLRMKKDQIDVYKQNIKALRSTFKRKPRPTSSSSLFITTTRKNRPTTTNSARVSTLWSSTLTGSKKKKTRSRSVSPPHKKGTTTKQNKSLRSSRSSSSKK